MICKWFKAYIQLKVVQIQHFKCWKCLLIFKNRILWVKEQKGNQGGAVHSLKCIIVITRWSYMHYFFFSFCLFKTCLCKESTGLSAVQTCPQHIGIVLFLMNIGTALLANHSVFILTLNSILTFWRWVYNWYGSSVNKFYLQVKVNIFNDILQYSPA